MIMFFGGGTNFWSALPLPRDFQCLQGSKSGVLVSSRARSGKIRGQTRRGGETEGKYRKTEENRGRTEENTGKTEENRGKTEEKQKKRAEEKHRKTEENREHRGKTVEKQRTKR